MPGTGLLELFKVKAAHLFITLFLFQSIVLSQIYPDDTVDSTLKAGIHLILMQNYPEAEKTFTGLDKKFPQLPLGKIYLAAVQIAKSYDYGEEYNESLIDSLLYLAKERSQKLSEVDGINIWNKYFLCLSEGYLAYFKALNGDWFLSLSEGINAIRDFQVILEQDRNFFEAYIAIGSFKYWKSRSTEFLDWLPGYVDEKEDGIALLEKAVRHSTYNTYLAINSLIWIYIDQKKYVKAVDCAENALTKYPGSRFFKWGLARAYEEIDAGKSLKIYKDILYSLPGDSNHYDEIVLKHLIAQQYVRLGENQEALKLCDDILSINNLDQNVHSKLENRLKRVEELKRELSR